MNALGVSIQLARRLAEGGPSLDPYWGFSISGRYERHLLAARGVELGAAFDFSFQHFETSAAGPATISPTSETVFDGNRLMETTFAVLPTVAHRWGRARPFAGAGVGVGVGFFSSQNLEPTPQSGHAVQPLARGGVGVDVALSDTSAVTVRADYTHTFTRPPARHRCRPQLRAVRRPLQRRHRPPAPVLTVGSKTAIVALLVVPAAALGALGLALVASASPSGHPGAPAMGAPHHFAVREAIALASGALLALVVARLGTRLAVPSGAGAVSAGAGPHRGGVPPRRGGSSGGRQPLAARRAGLR